MKLIGIVLSLCLSYSLLDAALTPSRPTTVLSTVCAHKPYPSEAALAKALHVKVKTIERLRKQLSIDTKTLCTLPPDKIHEAIESVSHDVRPDEPDKAMEFRMFQLSVHGKVKPDGMIKAYQARKEIVKKTERIRLNRYLKTKGLTGQSALNLQAVTRTVHLTSQRWKPLGPGNIGGRVRSLFIHPKNTDVMFGASVGGGIWRSIDGGTSWEPVNDFMANLAVTSIVADPTTTNDINKTVLYASTGEGFYNVDGIRGYGIFKSTDGGMTWQHLSSTDPSGDSDWYYINRLAVNNKGTLIAVARDNAVFTSSDGGNSWTKNSPGPNWYTIMEDVKFDPNNDNHAIVGSVNGKIYYSTDEGQTWTGVTIVDASSSWIAGRVELAYAKSTPNVVYASVDNNSGEIYRSDDGGLTWTYLSNPQHLGQQGWYDNAIWVDPTDSNHVVIAGLDIYRSTDGGSTWTKISTWQYAPSSPHADHHVLISDPNYDGISNKRLYDGNDGGFYKTDDITTVNDSPSSNGWTNLNHTIGITQFYGGAGIPGSKIVAGAQDNGSLIQADDNNTENWQPVFGGDGGMAAVSHQQTAGKFYYFGEYVYLLIHRSNDGASAEYIYQNGLSDAGSNANFIAPFVLDPNDDNVMLAGGDQLWRSTNVSTPNASDITWSSIKGSIGTNISQIAIAPGDSNIVLVGYNDGSIYKSTDATAASPTWTKIFNANGKAVLALMIDKDDHNKFYAGWGGFDAGNIQQSTDGGATWNDLSNGLPQAPVRSIVRHPSRSDYLYVGTEVGIFTSEDGGNTWFADNNGPANVSVDQLFWYDDAHLVAITHGRGAFIAKIELDPCEEVSRPLKAYDWTLVSFPCDTGNNTIADLLGDSLGTYGDNANWVMYEQTGNDGYKGPNTQKRLMDANDTLTPGKGYWIITDADRILKVDHTLPGLRFVNETNASSLNINDNNFSTVFAHQLPDSANDAKKLILLGNPFAASFFLNNVYFSHNNASDGYSPMSDQNDNNVNPNQAYVYGTVYTTDNNSSSTYKAVSPDTPGFEHTIEPMTGFYLILKSGQTGSNYLTIPNEE